MKASAPQLSLIDMGEAPRRRCPTCDTPLKGNRCHPCRSAMPAPGTPAWKRWVAGIGRVVRRRCEAAGHGRLAPATWQALMLDESLPAETAGLVGDLAAVPFTSKRYWRATDQAVTRSQIEVVLCNAGYPNGVDGGWVADNIAGRAAALIWAQRDRVSAGEVFTRVHDAELVHQAVLEHEHRMRLRGKGLRGPHLERVVAERTEADMVLVRGTWGRPSDEYPTEARIEAPAMRVDVHEVSVWLDEEAVLEAAEDEAMAETRERRAT